MVITVQRAIQTEEATIGGLSVDGVGECMTLEDVHRDQKVVGETRIPAGKYQIKLRNAGGMTKRYTQRFGDLHKGMLHLQNVPNFKWVYIHLGNFARNTDGCILVGSSADIKRQMVGNSTSTYKKLYKKIVDVLSIGEEVWVEVKD